MSTAADALGFDVTYVPFRVELFHPETGAPLLDEDGVQAFIEIDGYNSPAGEKIAKAQRVRLQMQQRGGRQNKQSDIDLDKVRLENAETLATLTRSWHLVNTQGQAIRDFECNFANARDLYNSKNRAWIPQALLAALSEGANFIQA